MKRAALVVIVVLALVAQLSLLPALRPLGVVPNVMLALVVLVGLEGTASLALLAAVTGGLAVDLASGTNFGLWSGVLVLAALVTGMVHRAGIELQGPVVALVMVAAGTLLMTLMILAGVANAVSYWPVGNLAERFFAELVLNLLLTVALRPLVRLVVYSAPPEVQIG